MEFSSIVSDPSIGAVLAGFDVSAAFLSLVLSIDPDAQMHTNYKKLAKAHRYLLEDESCLFMLTNDGAIFLMSNHCSELTPANADSTFPTNGTLYPGSGAISAALRYALPKRKPIVVGKPNQPMLDCILEKFALISTRSVRTADDSLHRHQLNRSRTIMIGDRLDTDIEFGVRGDIATLMVLTGERLNVLAAESELIFFVGVSQVKDYEAEDAETRPDFVVQSLGDLAVLASSDLGR